MKTINVTVGPPDPSQQKVMAHLRKEHNKPDECRLASGEYEGLARYAANDKTEPAAKPFTPADFDRAMRDLFDSIDEDAGVHNVRFDGVFADGEPDHDDGDLAVGDRVRVSFGGALGMPPEFRPFYYGTVRSTEPWDDSLAGMTFVSPDHMKSPEFGGWWPRDRLSRVAE